MTNVVSSTSLYHSALTELKVRQYFTPDLKELEENEKHILFVWDSFKLGFPSQNMLNHTKLLGEASTLENNFVMKVCPTFPIIYQVPPDLKMSQNAVSVLGEAYAVGVHDLLRMDAIMDNQGSYIRRKRYIYLHDQEWPGINKERRVVTEAWIYVATPFFQSEMSKSMQTGTQIKDKSRYYWAWLKTNMRPVN